MRCVGERFVSYSQLSLHFRQHPSNVTVLPIDLVQRILGHASLQTSSIYVRAERQHMLDAAAQYNSEDGD